MRVNFRVSDRYAHLREYAARPKSVARIATPKPRPKARRAAVPIVEVDLEDAEPTSYRHLSQRPDYDALPARSVQRRAPQVSEPAHITRGREFARAMEAVQAQIGGRKPQPLIQGPVQGVRRVTAADLNAVLRDEQARQRDRVR